MSFIVNSESNIPEAVALQPKVILKANSKPSTSTSGKIKPKNISKVECAIVPKRHIEVHSDNYTLTECHNDIVFLAERLYSLDQAETKRRLSYKFCCIYTTLVIISILLLAVIVFVFVTKYV